MEDLKTQLSYKKYNETFKGSHLYFVTIKPPRTSNRLEQVINLCYKYLAKRTVHYWIVPSISETQYNHYHGVIKLSCQTDIEKFRKAFQRKVNRDIGFNHPIDPIQDRKRVYEYIVKQRSTTYEFSDILPKTQYNPEAFERSEISEALTAGVTCDDESDIKSIATV